MTKRQRLASWVALILVASTSIVSAQTPKPGPANPEVARLKKLAMDHWIARSNRLQRVAQRVQVAGAEVCGRAVSPILGAAIVDLKKLPKSLKPEAVRRYGKKHRFYVTEVFEAMASERAGLKVGDAVVRLNGRKLERPSQFYGFERRDREPNQLQVSRDRVPVSLSVETVYGCRYPARLRHDEIVNAFATGKSVEFTTGYLRYFDDDSSLAQTVGHELGHSIFKVAGRRRFVDRTHWTSRKAEAQADYVGLYLSAMAGYRLSESMFIEFQKFQGIDDYSKKNSHPSGSERVAAAMKTIAEIEEKLRLGEPLELRFE